MSTTVYKPPSSSNIALKDVPVQYLIRSNDKTASTCIRGNITSPECILNTPTASPNCLAYCPDAKKVIRDIVAGSNNVMGGPAISKTTGGWSLNMTNVPKNTEAQGKMISSSIQYITPSKTVSCNLINAGSSNCLKKDSYGCQAYCNPKSESESPFIIEQRCPDNENSCDEKTLKWFKK